ncbi:hypothetical protein ILUMI_20205 [Ignelater luminosus]|uniref:Lipase n=1 Tax=Ignelater luminosus TaxID=2038154 RepID=A0A8K0CEQ2_IGNLU|nr:hypothetical protein ILUMI_20205 [Ignelater luminosus]
MLGKTIIFITFLFFANGYSNPEVRRAPPDTFLNVVTFLIFIINSKYIKLYHLRTEDGYILEMHRIPHGRNSRGNDTRPAVLVVPGVFCSSADWVNMGPEKSLGFMLADEGYDVWLANYRGTRWSRKHAKLNPDVDLKAYWTFSFQQIGYYDLPAFIDYILSLNKQEKLFYVGHSQGTTTFFALTSTRLEYNEKIRLSITLSPVAYMGHTTNPLIHSFEISDNKFDYLLVQDYHIYEILPYNPYLTLIAAIFCQDNAPTQEICASLLYMVAGYTPDQLNKTMMPVIASNTPAGASIVQGLHFTQLYRSKKFQMFDYGKEKNLEIYGQTTPPEYDLSKITAPVAMYYGSKDPACAKEDVDKAASEISNLVINKRIEGFSHIDVLWGIDVVPLLYNDIIELMKLY